MPASGTFEFGEVNFTLDAIYVMAYDITANEYTGSVGNIASPQTFKAEPEHDTDALKGSGRDTRLLSVAKGAKLNIEAGGMDFSARVAMTGTTPYVTGLTPNQVRIVRESAGGRGLPYFGAIGVGPTDDGGLIAFGLQACKLDSRPSFTLDGKENKFNMSAATGRAIPIDIDGEAYLEHFKIYESASDFTPPATAEDFLDFFTEDTA